MADGRLDIRTGTPVFSTRWRERSPLGATYAGSRGDFLGSSGRGFYSNQLDPHFLVLGNLLTQQATAANITAAQAIVPGIGLPYTSFSGTIAQMLRPFPQYSAVTDVYGDVAKSTYDSLQLTVEKRRSDDGLIVNFNYTFSRTEDNLTARTGYNFDQDWAVGVNDQPHVWNALVVYNLPFGAEGKPGSGHPVLRAIVKDWQISGITQFRSGRPLGLDSAPPATCRTPAPATPTSTRPSAAPSASMATTATATSSARPRRPTSTGPRFSRRRRSRTATRRGLSRSICATRARSTRTSASGAIFTSPA